MWAGLSPAHVASSKRQRPSFDRRAGLHQRLRVQASTRSANAIPLARFSTAHSCLRFFAANRGNSPHDTLASTRPFDAPSSRRDRHETLGPGRRRPGCRRRRDSGAGPQPLKTHQVELNGHTFTLPVGFDIELAAGPPLVDRPIVADFDEQGRLYVADSSGSNEQTSPCSSTRSRIASSAWRTATATASSTSRTVFADKMMFPEGLHVARRLALRGGAAEHLEADRHRRRRRGRPARRVVPGQDAHRLRQRSARPLSRARRLDLLVQGGVRQADLRAARASRRS